MSHNYGQVNHEPNPAYNQFVCFIYTRIKPLNKTQRRQAFNDMIINTTYDVKQLEVDVRAKFK